MSTLTEVNLREHTVAVIAALKTVTGLPVGDGEAPEEGAYQNGWGKGSFIPYLVVVRDDTKYSGPISDPQADATLMYRVLAVGKTRGQAEWASDKGRAGFNRNAIRDQGIPGRVVMGTVFTGTGGADADRGVHPPLWYVKDTYTLMTTPGAG